MNITMKLLTSILILLDLSPNFTIEVTSMPSIVCPVVSLPLCVLSRTSRATNPVSRSETTAL